MGSEKKVTRIENYSVLEILHLSFIIRDVLEYCANTDISEEIFEKRYKVVTSILAEDKFVANFLIKNPSEQGKTFYNELIKFFNNIYVNGNYVSLETRKADPDKKIEFLTEILKNEQTLFDVLKSFLNTLGPVVEEPIKECIKASEEFFRVLYNRFIFIQVVNEDNEFRKALSETKDAQSYECKFLINNLKELINLFRFNKEKYSYDDQLIIKSFEDTFKTFQILDRSVKVEGPEDIKNAVNENNKETINIIKRFESLWKATYTEVTKFINEHPINLAKGPKDVEDSQA